MNLSISDHSGTAMAAVSGDITHAVSEEFHSNLLLALRGSRALVLDCGTLNMLTSAGLRALLLLHREAAASGKPFVLAAVPPSVRDVMEVTGFWQHFTSLPTTAGALEAVAANGAPTP